MASDIFLNVAGVKGDSQDDLNEGWIEIDTVDFGFTMPTTAERSAQGAGTVGKVEVSPLTFSKTMDISSLELFKRLWVGEHIPLVEIKFYRAHQGGRICYMRLEMKDVVISYLGLSGMNGSGLPGESYALNYGTILIEYTPTQHSKGGAQPKPLRASLNRIENAIS